MLKGKVKVWVLMLLLVTAITEVPRFINQHILKEKVAVSIDIRNDSMRIKKNLEDETITVGDTWALISPTEYNPDIIITKEDLELEDYKELESFLYVPYVMFGKNCNGSSLLDSLDDYVKTKDIRPVLKAIENDQTWKDVGLYYKKDDTKVVLTVPQEGSEEYQTIREYIVLALNDFKDPQSNELERLFERADTILSKCEKTESIYSILAMDLMDKYILAPESALAEVGGREFVGYSIVPLITVKDDYNAYLREDRYDYLKKVITAPKFLNMTGLHNVETNKRSGTYEAYSTGNFNFVTIGEEVREKAKTGKSGNDMGQADIKSVPSEAEGTAAEAGTEESLTRDLLMKTEKMEQESTGPALSETISENDSTKAEAAEATVTETEDSPEEITGLDVFFMVFVIILVIILFTVVIIWIIG